MAETTYYKGNDNIHKVHIHTNMAAGLLAKIVVSKDGKYVARAFDELGGGLSIDSEQYLNEMKKFVNALEKEITQKKAYKINE